MINYKYAKGKKYTLTNVKESTYLFRNAASIGRNDIADRDISWIESCWPKREKWVRINLSKYELLPENFQCMNTHQLFAVT